MSGKKLDPRIEQITDLVIRCSMRDFTAKLAPAGEYDKVEAFMTSMNRMGEEMQASAVSRNVFSIPASVALFPVIVHALTL
ncbi:MAG: hypothetical protein ACHQRM_16610 [Bacteroidia bacterium]